MYLVAIMALVQPLHPDLGTVHTLDGHFCLSALREALGYEQPVIFNTDQGVQFTVTAFTTTLEQANVLISMDGRGAPWTTSSLNGSGVLSSMKTST